MAQIAATVKRNGEDAHEAREPAVLAWEAAGWGGSTVGEVIGTMPGVADESRA